MKPSDDDTIGHLEGIVGAAHCFADVERMAPYLREACNLFAGLARVVVRPATTDEVATVVRYCAERRLPVVPQGGNTGMCGAAVPQHRHAVVISTERLTRIRAVDPIDFTITVEAGCILADVQAAALAAGCFFPLSLGGERADRGGQSGHGSGRVRGEPERSRDRQGPVGPRLTGRTTLA